MTDSLAMALVVAGVAFVAVFALIGLVSGAAADVFAKMTSKLERLARKVTRS